MIGFWQRLGTRFLPFADAASPDLPLARLLRLSLFQVSVGMAAQLKPAIELSVVGQQEALAVRGDDPRRSRDVAGKAAAFEAIGAFANQFANPPNALDFTRVFAFVVGQQGKQRLAVHASSITRLPGPRYHPGRAAKTLQNV